MHTGVCRDVCGVGVHRDASVGPGVCRDEFIRS